MPVGDADSSKLFVVARENGAASIALLALLGCSRSGSSATSGTATDAGAQGPRRPPAVAVASASTVEPSSHEAPPTSPPVGFAVRAAFAVKSSPKAGDSVRAVEFLEDDRIRFEQLPRDGGVLGGNPCDPVLEEPVPRFCRTVKGRLRPARLRLVTDDGRDLSTLEMERPIASVEPVALRAGIESFQVTVDLSAGFGSYSGPLSKFAEVSNGKLRWLATQDASTGKTTDISVMSSLKTAWRLAPAVGGDREILEVACRPDFDASTTDAGMDFLVRLTRYAVEGDEWHRYVRVEKGFWEDDAKFPDRSRFR
jgi:hypothetical protein